MPSKTPKQRRTMRAACHSAAFRRKTKIPKSVACEFAAADSRRAKRRPRRGH